MFVFVIEVEVCAWDPPKKLQKTWKTNFCSWILCIIGLYPTSTSTITTKTNTPKTNLALYFQHFFSNWVYWHSPSHLTSFIPSMSFNFSKLLKGNGLVKISTTYLNMWQYTNSNLLFNMIFDEIKPSLFFLFSHIILDYWLTLSLIYCPYKWYLIFFGML